MALTITSELSPRIVLLDDGTASSLDSVAASVAIFGAGRFELVCAPDLDSLHQIAAELTSMNARAVIVVDVDYDPAPKTVLADAAELGFPLAVLSDGRNDAIHDHALSVGAAAYLLSPLPAKELVARLEALSL